MKTFIAVSLAAGLAAALPADSYGEAPATTTYACNPAHAYPDGVSCVSTAGSLTLVTPTTSSAVSYGEAPATTTYACNPAHAYPDGVSCVSTAGSLTLVTPTTSSAAATTTSAAAGDCSKAYDQCRGAPDANFSYCASKYAECLGYNPFTSSAAPTTTAATTAPPPKGDEKACYDVYNKCRGAPDANFSFCASKYAECLGYNPFANNGTNTVTPKESDTYVTQVVTKFTTYCPEPTTLTYQNKTYTVTSATTLTISDCPCTITTPAKSLTPVQTGTANPPVSVPVTTSPQPGTVIPVGNAPSQTVSAATSTRSSVPYTGAADKLNVGGAIMLGALGLFAL